MSILMGKAKAKSLKIMIVAATMALSATMASALTYFEAGSTGSLPGTAQMLPGGINQIHGVVNNASEADLYGFSWGGGGFYANTVGSPNDTQLFLFNAAGQGVMGNDDGIAFAGPAYIQTNLPAGLYYIGISYYDHDPYSAGGLMFQSYPWESLYGPLNSDPLSYWYGFNYGGVGSFYDINFQQITFQGDPIGDPVATNGVVPEPSTLLLMGCGVVGLFASRVRRKTA